MLTKRVGIDRQIRRRAQHAVFDNANSAALLADEYAAVGQQRHARDAYHAGGNLCDGKTFGNLRSDGGDCAKNTKKKDLKGGRWI